MKKMRKQFIKLLNIHGVSGKEGMVRRYLQPILTDMMDTVGIDKYGNLLAEKKIGNGIGATVLLSAHMDTVTGVLENRNLLIEGDVITSNRGALGADDRGGIAIIMEVLRNLESLSFQGTVKVAFSREEEIGCVGSENIDPHWYSDVDLAIVVDRKGSRDVVVGCWDAFCSTAVGEFFENASAMQGMDWKATEGGISDAVTFSSKGINSVNLSAGYYNEHTDKEYAVFSEMKDTVRLILQAFGIINTFYMTFGEVPQSNKWVVGYNYYKKNSKKSNSKSDNFDNFYQYGDNSYTTDKDGTLRYMDTNETAYVDDVFENDLYAEEDDINGTVMMYEVGSQVAILQGNNEILMSRASLKGLFDQVRGVLAK